MLFLKPRLFFNILDSSQGANYELPSFPKGTTTITIRSSLGSYVGRFGVEILQFLLIWMIFNFQIFAILKNLFMVLTNQCRARKVIRHVHKAHFQTRYRWHAQLRTRRLAVEPHVRRCFGSKCSSNTVYFTEMHGFY